MSLVRLLVAVPLVSLWMLSLYYLIKGEGWLYSRHTLTGLLLTMYLILALTVLR